MRRRDNILIVLCLIAAIGLLILAGSQLDYINTQRSEMRLIMNEPLENAPPSLAFATVAMGAFRGLLVDFLWIRADRLKDQGQFFDAKQLAEWITALQPRFASVWEFNAWNMAYNISVAIPATQPQQRWRWVKNGYELLRDKGIPLNPHSINLYRELGRIFYHKIGGVTDDAHKYYKIQLVESMEPLLQSQENRFSWQDNAFYNALAEAPHQLDAVLADPNTKPFIDRLKAADEAFEQDDQLISAYLALRQTPEKFDPQASKVIEQFRSSDVLKRFDIFARAYQLRHAWKIEPQTMAELNRQYGPISWNDPNTREPLDWRHPATHALYWLVMGLRQSRSQDITLEEINSDRIVGHALQELFRNGKIYLYDVPGEEANETSDPVVRVTGKDIFLRPDLRMFESFNQCKLRQIEDYNDIKRSGTLQSLKDGHRNMMMNAIVAFYQGGHLRQAHRVYNLMRQLYPRDDNQVPLVSFVRNLLKKDLQSMTINDAKELVIMMLREGYFYYAMRDDDQAFAREEMAEEVYDIYRGLYPDEHRIELPQITVLRFLALNDFFNDLQYPVNLRLMLLKRIENDRPELAEKLKEVQDQLLEEARQQQPEQ